MKIVKESKNSSKTDEILWIIGPDVYKILKQHYINIVNWENK